MDTIGKLTKSFRKFFPAKAILHKPRSKKPAKIAITAAVVGTAVIYMIRNRRTVATVVNKAYTSISAVTREIAQYSAKLKDRLLNNIKGPNGEDVFSDMYNRLYYVTDQDRRVYLDME